MLGQEAQDGPGFVHRVQGCSPDVIQGRLSVLGVDTGSELVPTARTPASTYGRSGEPRPDVTGMHDAGKHPVPLSRQIPLDCQLVDTVFPVGVLGRILGRRTTELGP